MGTFQVLRSQQHPEGAAKIQVAVADIKQLHVYDFDNTRERYRSEIFYCISDVL